MLFTGTANKEVVMKAAKLGVADYLVKPFALRDLGLRVHRQLDDLTPDEAREVMANLLPANDHAIYASVPESREGGWRVYSARHSNMDACAFLKGGEGRTGTNTRIYIRRGTTGWRRVWSE